MSFDYHRAMTDAVVEAPKVPHEHLVWIMTPDHRARYRQFLEFEMGVEPDDGESFGIPIMDGEPRDGQPFELVIRSPD
ncbi:MULTISPECIES: hypothetical protein [Citromicrobium]|uniref:hypothetical protein n=1 Tax=Citromicrobium TaxID=72173 RepID=UPI00048E0EE3|nr:MULTISPECIES: hypothetical protein [Citromicrobium]KPM14696.1 hypothetical protein VO58_11085 [Citromicrobium sp. JL1351]KPM22952.1 hypothetical protein VO57_12050 [Citromicrobium sp. JL2201]